MVAGLTLPGLTVAGQTVLEIRSCRGMEEFDACVRLEMDTWGYDATEVVPRKTFLLAQKIGGQVMAAFQAGDDGRQAGDHKDDESAAAELLGFVMSLPAFRQTQNRVFPYLHSHMLAVRPREQNRGIGAQLKWAQRAEAMARGIERIEWTFDPLEIKNAHLNIHRLGAVCRSYCENFYGVSSSRLQGGLPTDRLLAEWELDAPRVRQSKDRQAVSQAAIREHIVQERIMVPASIEQWKASATERTRALAVQTENRCRFQQAFARGLAVIGYTRDAQGNGIFELGELAE
jgi:predicted GNAT superfamily acetyltransferase